jgi:hypothetical protein
MVSTYTNILHSKPVDEFENTNSKKKKVKNHIPPVADLSPVAIPSHSQRKIEEKRVPLSQDRAVVTCFWDG